MGSGQLSFVDQSSIAAGTATYATTAGTATYASSSGSSDTALSLIISVKNSTGITIPSGSVVCFDNSVATPSGNVIPVKLADNNGTDSMPGVGITTSAILDGSEGAAIMFGKASGFDTSTFSTGDVLYVSDTPGEFTTTKPNGVKYIQRIGIVVKVHASNGSLEIFGAGRVNDVPTPLYIDHANQRVGIGAIYPSEKLDIEGADPSILIKNTTFGSGESSLVFKTAMGATNSFAVNSSNNLNYKNTLGSSIFTIENGGYVGVGTTSPTNGKLVIDSTANQIAIETGTAGDGRLNIGHFSNGTFIGTYGDDGGVADIIRFGTHSGDERMRITSTGNVGIGTTGPSQKLEVNGNIKMTETAATTDTDKFAVLDSGVLKYRTGSQVVSDLPTDTRYVAVTGDTMTGTLFFNKSGSGQIKANNRAVFGTHYTSTDVWIYGGAGDTILLGGGIGNIQNDVNVGNGDFTVSNGNVGIGTTSPQAQLHIGDSQDDDSGLRFTTITGGNNDAVNLHFQGSAAAAPFYISRKNTGGAEIQLQYDGDIILNGNNGDNVGIGTNVPQQQLHVAGASLFGGNIYFGTGTSNYINGNGGGFNSYVQGTLKFAVKYGGQTEVYDDLEVDGDMLCEVVGKGLVLKSPNGTRYRIKVDNSGNLSTETY